MSNYQNYRVALILCAFAITGCVSVPVSKNQAVSLSNANQRNGAKISSAEGREVLASPSGLMLPSDAELISQGGSSRVPAARRVFEGCGVTSWGGEFYVPGEWTAEQVSKGEKSSDSLLKTRSIEGFRIGAMISLVSGDFGRSELLSAKLLKSGLESVSLQGRHLSLLSKKASLSPVEYSRKMVELGVDMPRSMIVNLNAGMSLARVGNTRDALLFYRRAIASEPTNPIPYVHASDAAFRLGMSGEAEMFASKAKTFSEDARNMSIHSLSRYNLAVVLKDSIGK